MNGSSAPAAAPVRVRAARDRRFPWVALAVVLVVTGALSATVLVQSAGERRSVLVAARPIAVGQVVTDQDVRVVGVGVDGQASVVGAEDRGLVVGRVATVGVPQGSLLARAQFSEDGGLPAGRVAVGAVLAAGEVPVPGLRAGDTVEMVAVSGAQGVAVASLGQASVFSIAPASQGGSAFVSLVVPGPMGVLVADVAAQQRLRLLLLPTGPGAGG